MGLLNYLYYYNNNVTGPNYLIAKYTMYHITHVLYSIPINVSKYENNTVYDIYNVQATTYVKLIYTFSYFLRIFEKSVMAEKMYKKLYL